jgi:protein-disulfide isomerase
LCASDISVDTFVLYHNYLFRSGVQPAEGSSGRTDSELESYAAKIGVTGSALTTFDTCVSQQTHKALVQAITDQASRNGVNATPTIKVNGKSITPTLAAWNAAIAAAAKQGPAPTTTLGPLAPPSPTPTPSATPSATVSPSPTPSASSSAKKPKK